MDVLDSTEKEALTGTRGTSEGPTNTMTTTTLGTGRGGKRIHKSQAEGPGSRSAVTTPKKAKPPESSGAQPKTTAQYTFASQDVWYKDATQPTKFLHPQGKPNPLKDPLGWVRWHVACYWGHINSAPPCGLMNCGVFVWSTTRSCQWCWWLCGIFQQRLDEGWLWYTVHYYLCPFAWCVSIQKWIPSDDGVVEPTPSSHTWP